jgi:hypothetical protein
MNRLVAGLAALTCTIGFTAAPAIPAAANSVTVPGSGWSITLTIPDWQWTSESCQFVPVRAEVTGPEVTSWTFGGFVTEDNDDEGDTSWYIDYDTKVTDGPGTFTFRHAILLCPGYEYSGAYSLVGEVGVLTTAAPEWAWLPYRAAFTVSGLPTTTTLDPIAVAAGEAIFSGTMMMTGQAPASFRGCGSSVTIQMETGSGWEGVGWAEVSDNGSFAAVLPTNRLTGTQYRATSNGDYSICASSTSGVQALPVRLPSVRVTSDSKQSKLKVDIDPNRGRKAWTFQVQRQIDDETWKAVGTYRTKGSHETRTINLRKGIYRVSVRAQAGYAETYSDTVWLER